MKVILRDLNNGLYFSGHRLWVDSMEGAAAFGSVEEAARAAAGSGGQDVAVVLKYDDPEREVALNPAYCLNAPKRKPRVSPKAPPANAPANGQQPALIKPVASLNADAA